MDVTGLSTQKWKITLKPFHRFPNLKRIENEIWTDLKTYYTENMATDDLQLLAFSGITCNIYSIF
jgi:hypothetical protein